MKVRRYEIMHVTIGLLLLSLLQPVSAASITREYDQGFAVMGDKYFSFRIKVAVDTEPNGKWRTDTYYAVNILLSLTYLNESIFSPTGFRVLFHSPRLLVNERPFGYGSFEMVASMANATVGMDGTITMKYRPHELDGERLQMKCVVEYTMYVNEKALSFEPIWTSPDNITIDVEKAAPSSDNFTILLFACVAVLVIAVPAGAYLMHKSRRSKREATT